MGQLRDWWPSEDALAKRSSALLQSPMQMHPSPLQLSEAAAALSEDNILSPHVPNSQPISSFAFLPSSVPQPRPRAPIKLINSQDHKQELLRNLLNPRPADLLQQAHTPLPSLQSPDGDMLNPKSPGSFGLLLQQVHSKPSSSSPQANDVPLSLFKKYIPSTPTQITTHDVQHHTIEESLTSERTSGGSSHEVHHLKESTSEKNTVNKGLETLHDPINKQSLSSEKTRILHDVQHHPINKESLSRREIHIFSERERRKGMTHLYTTLLSLLPDAKPKTDRCKVLTDAIDYIQGLREQVESLGSQKAEILASLGELGDNHNTDYTSSVEVEAANSSTIAGFSDETKEEILSSADVAVRFCGKEAFITLNSSKSKGVWSGILQILHEQNMEILNVTLSSGNEMDHHCIHARISTTATVRSEEIVKMLQDFVLSHAIID